MAKEKLYFESIDDIWCSPLKGFIDDAKNEKLKEITLVEAIPETDKDFVWCTHEAEVIEQFMCKKSECPYYSSKSGRGVCEHRGNLYLHGEEVKFDVKTSKKITYPKITNL